MKRAQPGWLVLALAAIAAAVGSFLPFYTFSANIELTVWSRNIFPTATLIPVLVVLIGLEALFVLVMGHEPRSPFLNFTWSQARLAGSCFAIVLALSFLVQGRAGADLGSGYLVVSLSALAALAGAVMTRRSELARGREEIVGAEHPWRAAALRWRRELNAKVEAFAAGANEPRVQPAPVSKDGEKQEDEKPVEKPVDEPVETPEEPPPTTTPVPRLSAVRSETEADTKSRPAARTRTPSKRPSKKKAASKKTVPKTVEPTLVEVEHEGQKPAATKTERRKTEERKTEERKADEPEARPAETPTAEERTAEEPTAEEPTAEEPTAEEPTAEVPKTDVESAEPTAELESTEPESTESDTAEHKTADITAEVSPAKEGEAEPSSDTMEDDDAERERPAAPS